LTKSKPSAQKDDYAAAFHGFAETVIKTSKHPKDAIKQINNPVAGVSQAEVLPKPNK